MRSRHWMPLYWGDYFQDTRHLSTLEHGAYLLLIARYWVTGAPLPDDDLTLAKAAGLGRRAWQRVKPVLAAFFTIDGGTWRHGRIDRELLATELRAAHQSAAGKASALKRQQTRSTTVEPPLPSGSTYHSHSHSHIDPPSLPSGERPPRTTKANGLNGGNGHERGSRLAADWEPTPEDREFARSQGLDDGLVRDTFRDYWHAATGARATKRDWRATWRNWCRNQARMDAERRSRTGQRGPVGFGQAAATLIRRYEREGGV